MVCTSQPQRRSASEKRIFFLLCLIDKWVIWYLLVAPTVILNRICPKPMTTVTVYFSMSSFEIHAKQKLKLKQNIQPLNFHNRPDKRTVSFNREAPSLGLHPFSSCPTVCQFEFFEKLRGNCDFFLGKCC